MSNFLTNPTKPRLTQLVSLVALIIFLPLLLFGAQQLVELVSRASGSPANIVINTKVTLEPLNLNFYHAFAQGGEEQGDMLQPVASQVKALNPQYIRLDHLYDFYNVVGKSGDQLTFDWSRLDKSVNTILATGAKPLLALSYMPPVIAKDGVVINPPDNWNDWALVVQKTIEHYSGRGEKNIGNVYYEVWNEPDLTQFGSWRYYGDKNYITLYQYASAGARNAQNVNAFHLCGPGTTGLYKEWVLALINSGARLDCISWHTYQTDPAKYLKDQQDLSTWLLPYPSYTLVPKLITEFGFTGSKSVLYGSQYAAAHTAAVVRQLLSNGISFALSFQPKDGPGDTSGNGWGLITHENNGKREKPRYYVYSFIDAMAGTRISLTGEGTWVTGFASTKNNVIRVLLVNFDPNGTHTETVPVTFGALDPGTYKLRQHFFRGSDVTLTETVVPVNPNQSKLGALSQSSQSAPSTIQKKILMPPSSILELELSKQ